MKRIKETLLRENINILIEELVKCNVLPHKDFEFFGTYHNDYYYSQTFNWCGRIEPFFIDKSFINKPDYEKKNGVIIPNICYGLDKNKFNRITLNGLFNPTYYELSEKLNHLLLDWANHS